MNAVLLVIFGAGASHDSVPSHPANDWRIDRLQQRPPLANNLFDQRELFADAVSGLHQFRAILPQLRHPQDGVSVEDVLQRFQEQGATNTERFRQLTAVRYYLNYVIWRISDQWYLDIIAKNGSNYETLLDQIRQHRTERQEVGLVTFNYDTLLERALPTVGARADQVEDYIAHDIYKVFKLHGSTHWAHTISTPIVPGERNLWGVLAEIIERAPNLKVNDDFVVLKNHLLADLSQSHLYPAIAILLKEKNVFECPSEHLEALGAFLPSVSHVLIVGWKATEERFLRLLADTLPRTLRGLVVCGNRASAETTVAQLQQVGINTTRFDVNDYGFSDFVLKEHVAPFLRG